MEHNFKIGDHIIITKPPLSWSSELNDNYPLDKKIKYPYYCQIKDLKYVADSQHWAMTDNIYGWSLSTLIIEEAIIKDVITLRKDKLKKIYEKGR